MLKTMTNNARQTALFILNTLDKAHSTLDNILEEVLEQNTQLSRRDRALAHALVYGVLRWRARLDWIIRRFSKTPVFKINPEVMNILRLGLFQMVCLDRIPVSAAVNTSVEMAKSFAAPWVVRFVNGLLRNAAREMGNGHGESDIGNWKLAGNAAFNDPVSELAATKSFPKWLIKRWLNRFGREETETYCDAVNTIPPITVRANTLKTTREQLMSAIESDVEHLEATHVSSDGISFFNPATPVSEMNAFQEGWFQVQDEAAQLVTLLLDPQPGETILDACAGLGGKTGHIAQMMQNQGHIVATDKDGRKLDRLKSEMKRLGVSIVRTVTHDLDATCKYDASAMLSTSHFSLLTSQFFDRILLDAPCSGLGVLRRNPDAKWSASEKDLKRFKERQIRFLDHLAGWVKPSGILVYAVCSREPEENEAVVTAFLNQHPEFELETPPCPPQGGIADHSPFEGGKGDVSTGGKGDVLKGAGGCFEGGMDAFFSVRFKRVR